MSRRKSVQLPLANATESASCARAFADMTTKEGTKDQLCGRMVCGLPFNNETFGVLPPHFGPYVLGLLTEEYWCDIVPGILVK